MYTTPAFEHTVCSVWGPRGSRWLEGLRERLADIQTSWGLVVESAYPLSYNLVLRAHHAAHGACVLKVGVPCEEFTREVETLQNLQGSRCVRLLEADAPHGVILLERIQPGRTLYATPTLEDAAVRAAELFTNLPVIERSQRIQTLPDLAGWTRSLRSIEAQTVPDHYRLGALDKLQWLEETRTEPNVLLHGDFHHRNILWCDATRRWRTIDPKGFFAERCHAFGAFVTNQCAHPQAHGADADVLNRTVRTLAETLHIPEDRLKAAVWVYCVLSACWSVEDNEAGWETVLRYATYLEGTA